MAIKVLKTQTAIKVLKTQTAIKVLTLAALAIFTSCQHPDFASLLDRDRDTIPTPPTTPGTPDTETFTIHVNDQWNE